jgi:hypothetical protein
MARQGNIPKKSMKRSSDQPSRRKSEWKYVYVLTDDRSCHGPKNGVSDTEGDRISYVPKFGGAPGMLPLRLVTVNMVVTGTRSAGTSCLYPKMTLVVDTTNINVMAPCDENQRKPISITGRTHRHQIR